MQAQMLAPAAVLVVWSLVMMFWMAGVRLPAMRKAGVTMDRPGARGQDLEGTVAPHINWPAHNYSHLMEQPTIFYPTVVILAMMGPGATDVALAWAYVAIRIIHSLWQATVNKVPIRFLLFLVSSLVLVVLAIRALMVTAFADPSLAPA
ncbi:MAG: MAPEG family protein [Erythrobacter sp.]